MHPPARVRLGLVVLTVLIPALGQAQSADLGAARANLARETISALPTTSGAAAPTESGPGSTLGDVAPSSPGDMDLGEQLILSRIPRYQMFTVFADTSLYWTSNAALLDNANARSDMMWVSQLGFSVQPKLTENIFLEATVRQQVFQYNRYDFLNFNSFDAGGGLTGLFDVLGGLGTFLRFNYNRLVDPSDYTEISVENTLQAGINKPIPINRAQYAYAGANASWSLWTTPWVTRRHSYNLFAGYGARLARSLDAQVYYRLSLYDYTTMDRLDVAQTVGLGLTFNFSRWFSLNASTSAVWSRSTMEVFNYNVVNAGGGLSASVRF